jgi:hypothetical protein
MKPIPADLISSTAGVKNIGDWPTPDDELSEIHRQVKAFQG